MFSLNLVERPSPVKRRSNLIGLFFFTFLAVSLIAGGFIWLFSLPGSALR